MCCYSSDIPLHLFTLVLFLNAQTCQSLVFLHIVVEQLVSSDPRSNGLQLIVVPVLNEHLLHARARPPERHSVHSCACPADENTIGKAYMSRLCVMAVNAEFIVRVPCQEGGKILTQLLWLG